MLLHTAFEEQARLRPNKPLDISRELSFSTVNDTANQIARFLRHTYGQHENADLTIALFMPMCVEYVVLQLAVLKAGFAVLPVTTNENESHKRLLGIIADKDLVCVISSPYHSSSAFVHQLAAARDDLTFYSIDSIKEASQAYATTDLNHTITLDDLAYKAYSSGSTGEPKKALITHRGLLKCMRSIQRGMEMRDTDVMAVFADNAFDAHWVEIYTPLTMGASIRIIPPDDKLDLSRLKHFYDGVTMAIFTPEMLKRLSPRDFPKLRVIISTGDVLPPELEEKWKHCLFIDGYGPMEVTVATYLKKHGQVMLIDGLAIFLCRFDEPSWKSDVNQVLDQACNEVGEIYIAGDGLARGYSDEALTKERFIEIPHPEISGQTIRTFKTGDLARWNHGNLEIVGRIDRQWKFGGVQVHATEIEKHIRDFDPDIAWCYVNVEKLDTGHKRLFAYLYLDSQREQFDVQMLSRYIEQKTNRRMIPAFWYFLSEVPKLSNNLKLDRDKLNSLKKKKVYSQGCLEISDLDQDKEKFVEIWCQSLELGDDYHPKQDDNFFMVGGTSLQFLDFIQRVNDVFELKIKFNQVIKDASLSNFFRLFNRVKNNIQPPELMELIPHQLDHEPPWIVIHSLLGNVEQDFQKVITHWSSRRGLYAINARGLEHFDDMDETIEQMAEAIIESIVKFSNGRILMGGYSLGGLVGCAVVNGLRRRGYDVIFCMFDSKGFDYYQGLKAGAYHAFLRGLFDDMLKGIFRITQNVTPNLPSTLNQMYPEYQIYYFFNTLIQLADKRYHNVLATIRAELLAVYRYNMDYVLEDVDLWYATQSAKCKDIPAEQQLFWKSIRFDEVLALAGDHFSILLDEPKAKLFAEAMEKYASYKVARLASRNFRQQVKTGYINSVVGQRQETEASDFQAVIPSKVRRSVREKYIDKPDKNPRAIIKHSAHDDAFARTLALDWANDGDLTRQFDLVVYIRLSALLNKKPLDHLAQLNIGYLLFEVLPFDTTGIHRKIDEASLTQMMSVLLPQTLWMINDDTKDRIAEVQRSSLYAIIADIWDRHQTNMIAVSDSYLTFKKAGQVYVFDELESSPTLRAVEPNTLPARAIDSNFRLFSPEKVVRWAQQNPRLNTPKYLVPRFRDQQPLVEELRKTLAQHLTVVICGPAGCGKSSFVNTLASCVDYKDRVLHFDCNNEEALNKSRQTNTKLLMLDTQGVDANEMDRKIIERLQRIPRTLLVFDDVVNEEQALTLSNYLLEPTVCEQHHILIQSWSTEWTRFKMFPVSYFSPSESLAYLRKIMIEHYQAKASEEHMAELANMLGHHPLSLSIAAHSMGKFKPIEKYIRDYRASAKVRRHQLSNRRMSRLIGDVPYNAWDRLLDILQQYQEASTVLNYAALLSGAPISFKFFTAGKLNIDELELEDALQTLSGFSLIIIDWASESFIIHAVLQEVIRCKLVDQEKFKPLFDEVYEHFLTMFSYTTQNRGNASLCNELLVHAVALVEAKEYEPKISNESTSILRKRMAEYFLYERRDTSNAIKLLNELKSEDHDTVEINSSLSFAMLIEGRYQDSYMVCQQVLARSVEGMELESTSQFSMAYIHCTIAHFYAFQAEIHWDVPLKISFLLDAKLFYERSLALFKAINPELPEVKVLGSILSGNSFNLYTCDRDFGDLNEIKSRFSQHAQATYQEFSKKHPNALHLRATLAEIAFYEGHTDLMVRKFDKIIRDAVDVFGTEIHTELSSLYRRYGTTLVQAKRYDAAYEVLKKAESIRHQKYNGKMNIDFIPTIQALCTVARLLGKDEEADEYSATLSALQTRLKNKYGTVIEQALGFAEQQRQLAHMTTGDQKSNGLLHVGI